MASCLAMTHNERLLLETPWRSSAGLHQTRCKVFDADGQYRAEVEVMLSGGDREVIDVGYFATQRIAEEQGCQQELAWHIQPERRVTS